MEKIDILAEYLGIDPSEIAAYHHGPFSTSSAMYEVFDFEEAIEYVQDSVLDLDLVIMEEITGVNRDVWVALLGLYRPLDAVEAVIESTVGMAAFCRLYMESTMVQFKDYYIERL